jgi:hypothetical protein
MIDQRPLQQAAGAQHGLIPIIPTHKWRPFAYPNTGAPSATQDGSDDVTDTAQFITELECCQIMEINETQGVTPTIHDVESNIFSIKSRGHSPIRNKKEAAATDVVGDVEMAQ